MPLLRHMMLALLLLLAQHAAALHGLEHAQHPHGDEAPTHGISAGCLGLHGIDDAPTASEVAEPGSCPVPEAPGRIAHARRDAPPASHYDSRAPPRRS